ncbi:MAG: Alkaline phosphatase [Thermoleophilia bacterium]|nr:Alkaline phosphatase [Thermoleophilia bacterium]
MTAAHTRSRPRHPRGRIASLLLRLVAAASIALVGGCGTTEHTTRHTSERTRSTTPAARHHEPAAPAGTVLVAAGDIACPPGEHATPHRCGDAATARLAASLDPAVVLTLGDEQYDAGELEDYRASFDRTWGKLRPRMHPTPGNHEYASSGRAAGYRAYFGPRATPGGRTYFSFDVGGWHLVSLDSNCTNVAGGCGAGSPQQRWLVADLRAHHARCTLAYWHHPRFSSGLLHGSSTDVDALYRTLDAGGADVVLNGHEHNYERFAPQHGDGSPARGAVREFVVGTGGNSLYPFGPAIANSEVRRNDAFGVLELQLRPTGYAWRFHAMSSAGSRDHGTGACH